MAPRNVTTLIRQRHLPEKDDLIRALDLLALPATATEDGLMAAADKAKIDQLPPTAAWDFATMADLEASDASLSASVVTLAGYHAAGDGGGGVWKRVASQPSHDAYRQDAAGGYWVPESHNVDVRQLGAKGDTVGLTGAGMDAGSTALTVSAGATLTASDVGKAVLIVGAGGRRCRSGVHHR